MSAFRFDENDKYGFALAELEVLDGERNIALGAKVFAPDGVESDFWAPSKLTDGDIYWHRGGPVTPMAPPVLRKEFSLSKAPKRVTVYSSALGLYEMRINGRRVGSIRLVNGRAAGLPGWSAQVSVGPPLSANAPRRGSPLRKLTPLALHVPSATRLLTLLTMSLAGIVQSAPGPLLAITILRNVRAP